MRTAEEMLKWAAIRRATDPFGMHGENTGASRPDPIEVMRRLEAQGYTIVRLTTNLLTKGEQPIGGIEQYQDEDR